jgi:hypothetical protein
LDYQSGATAEFSWLIAVPMIRLIVTGIFQQTLKSRCHVSSAAILRRKAIEKILFLVLSANSVIDGESLLKTLWNGVRGLFVNSYGSDSQFDRLVSHSQETFCAYNSLFFQDPLETFT